LLGVCILLGADLIALQDLEWHAAEQVTSCRLACHAGCRPRGSQAGAPCIDARLPWGARDSDDWSDAEEKGKLPARPARARGAFDGSAAGAASALAARARGATGAPAAGGAAASGTAGLVSQAAKDHALALMAASAPSAAPRPGPAPAALAAALKAAPAGGLAGVVGVAGPASGGSGSGGADSGVPDAVAAQLAEAAAAQTTQAAPSQAARAAPARAAAAPIAPDASPPAPTRKATAASPAVAPAARLRPFDAQAAEVRNGCIERRACMGLLPRLCCKSCPPCRLCCRARLACGRPARDMPALQVLSTSVAMARPQPPPAPAGRPALPPPPPLPRRLPPLSWLPRGGAGRQPGEAAQAAAAPQATAPAATAFGSWLPGKSVKPPASSAAADAGVPGQRPARAPEPAQRAQPAQAPAPAREAQAASEALRGGGAPLMVLLGAVAAAASALEPLFQARRSPARLFRSALRRGLNTLSRTGTSKSCACACVPGSAAARCTRKAVCSCKDKAVAVLERHGRRAPPDHGSAPAAGSGAARRSAAGGAGGAPAALAAVRAGPGAAGQVRHVRPAAAGGRGGAAGAGAPAALSLATRACTCGRR